MFKLVIADDEGKQTVVPIVRDEITVGRQEGNTIRLTERNVSRRHARLLKQNGSLYFEEVAARYGSYRNGDRVAGRVPFNTGDVFTIGDYRLFLQNPDGTLPEVIRLQQQAAAAGASGPAAAVPPQDSTEVLELGVAPAPMAAPAEPAKLVVLNTELAGNTFALINDATVIGRTDENDICIDHRSISRHHARVERLDQMNYRIADLGSANGVKVNGELFPAIELRRGDVVELGSVKFRFVAPGEPFSFTPAAADYAEGRERGGLGKLIGIFAVILVVVAGGLVVILSRGDGEAGSEEEGTTTERGTEETSAVTEETARPTAPDYAQILADASASMAEADWDSAISLYEQIPVGTSEYEAADQGQIRARLERRNQEIYERLLGYQEARNFSAALTALAEIPEDSYYQTLLTEQNLAQRIQQAWIQDVVAASSLALESQNYAQARQVLEPALQQYPGEANLTQQLAAVDQAEQAAVLAAAEREREEQEREATRQIREETEAAEREREREREAEREREEEERTVAERPSREETEERPSERTTEREEPEVDPEEQARELIQQARRLGIRGENEEAIDLLRQAQELDPGEARIYLMLYTNYSRTGDNCRAADALNEYIRRRPNDPNVPEYREIIERLESDC